MRQIINFKLVAGGAGDLPMWSLHNNTDDKDYYLLPLTNAEGWMDKVRALYKEFGSDYEIYVSGKIEFKENKTARAKEATKLDMREIYIVKD